MDEFKITGYFKRCFVNNNGRVANFYVKGMGNKTSMGFRDKRPYKFETWIPELIEKVAKIPRESIVTVTFEIEPKELIINQQKYDTHVLKASLVIHWEKPKSKEVVKDEENEYVQSELRFEDSPG